MAGLVHLVEFKAMKTLEKTWRWFGVNDTITLDDLKQMGVEGVVTALHHIPNGEVWPVDEIMKVKLAIEAKGMRWSVVESLPVSEGIKLHSDDYPRLVDNYQQSMRNLGKCGINTICYNFMPVLDWARTDLHYKLPNGGESMLFDFPTFVAFDVFILKRPNAANDYPKHLLDKARVVFETMDEDEAEKLAYNIIVVTQGFIDGVIDGSVTDPKALFLEFISKYNDIDKQRLRDNLESFLDDIIPVAEDVGINMCIHPDDPPFQILGLPRIIGGLDDMKWLMSVNDSPNNGITFCAGSLSAKTENDLLEIVSACSDKIHFAHLRNTSLQSDGSFFESGHTDGSQNMPKIIKALLTIQNERKIRIPIRPDHGIRILSDYQAKHNPGYPLVGRLKGLSEIVGMETAIIDLASDIL